MAVRRRPVAEFEATSDKLGTQTVTLAGVIGGYNGYSNPELLSPQFWAASSQLYAGLFGSIRRARFATVLAPNASTTVFTISNIFNTVSSILPTIGNTVISVTTSSPTGYGLGQLVQVVGAPGTLNGTYPIVQILSNTNFYLAAPPSSSGSGATGTVRVAYVAQASIFTTLRAYSAIGISNYVLGDANGKLFSFDIGASYNASQRVNLQVDPTAVGSSLLNGPWSRGAIQVVLYEMNGFTKQSGRGANAAIVEGFGLDAPDASPQVVINAGSSQNITNIQRTNGVVTVNLAGALTVPGGNGIGTVNVTVSAGDTSFVGTFVVVTGSGTTTLTWAQPGQNTALLTPTGTVNVSITKAIGRSYSYAWENANKGSLGPPSPSTQFIQYTAQNGLIQLVEPGTLAWGIVPSGSVGTITGTGTSFSTAWIGRYVWASTFATIGRITAVADATHMSVVFGFSGIVTSGITFQIFDPQATHIRLYETGDGAAVQFRVQRNVFNPAQPTLVASGLQFFDNSNAEPPNFPFTSEIVQSFNVPPPIGQFIGDYQGRLVVFGVPGALQSFFYSNIETTVVGQPPECYAPLNQVTLPTGDGQLNGWANLPTGAIIWSNHQDMFKLTGLLTDNTVSNQFQLGATIQRLPYRMGCGSAYAVSVTNLGVFWLTADRQVQLFTDHYAPKNVGLPIQDVLNRINSRIGLAKMKNYKRGDRNWLALALSLDSSTFNNKLCLLDLDLLASNGQPSFFTFDMATNQPTWYLFDINCESIESAIDNLSQNHLLCGDVDLITDADYHPPDFAISENNVTGAGVTLHAIGNEAPEVMKQLEWLRANTNQLPSAIAAQGWTFGILQYDDEQWVLGAANTGNLVTLTPGVNSSPLVIGLENSPADFRFDGATFAKGRRFQLQANFPSTPGNWEFRGFQVKYTGLYER